MAEIIYCRTCRSTENLSLIFDGKKTSTERFEELFLVTGVEIKLNDDLSQLICETCNNLVNESLKLRSQSQETDKLLRSNRINIQNCLKTNYRKNRRQNETKHGKRLNKKQHKDISNNRVNIENSTKQETEIKKPVKVKKKKQIEFKEEINSVPLDETNSVNTRRRINRINTEKPKLNNKEIKNINKKSLNNETNDSDVEFDDPNDIHSSDSVNGVSMKANDIIKEKKHKRKRLSKEELQKYMSLAVQPLSKIGPVRCALCRVQLRERRFFINHAKTHFEAEHCCEICDKKFTNRNTLRYHQQRLHGAARRLGCAQCPYRAVDKATLQNHYRAAHTGERPYVCDVCGDTFRVRATIAQHMRSHFAAYDVQCEKCPALFRSRSELASHRNKVHLMTYTYYCYLCPESYKAVGTVKNHIVKVHGVPRDQHPPIKCTKARRNCRGSVSTEHRTIECLPKIVRQIKRKLYMPDLYFI